MILNSTHLFGLAKRPESDDRRRRRRARTRVLDLVTAPRCERQKRRSIREGKPDATGIGKPVNRNRP
jgi:hypothetical protein